MNPVRDEGGTPPVGLRPACNDTGRPEPVLTAAQVDGLSTGAAGGHLSLADLFPLADLEAEIASGHVTRKRHPELPLYIHTYTPRCQYENHWTPVTTACRGLIADDAGRVVALPFPKIFASAMHGQGHAFAPPLPMGERFEIYDKVDGSLVIVHHWAGRWRAATKGSFTSVQAQWAQARLEAADTDRLDPRLTYLAEAVYPANRIVVDYGDREDLVLLAARRRADRREAHLGWIAHHWSDIGTVVHRWGMSHSLPDLEALAAANTTPRGTVVRGIEVEGVVIRYASGLRAKVKLAEYLRYHAAVTGTNERTIWAALVDDVDIGDLFDHVPDEFRDWAHRVAAGLTAQADAWILDATAAYLAVGPCPDRRTFAERVRESPYRAALFMLLDRRDIKPLAWKAVRPRADTPFRAEPED